MQVCVESIVGAVALQKREEPANGRNMREVLTARLSVIGTEALRWPLHPRQKGGLNEDFLHLSILIYPINQIQHNPGAWMIWFQVQNPVFIKGLRVGVLIKVGVYITTTGWWHTHTMAPLISSYDISSRFKEEPKLTRCAEFEYDAGRASINI